jgi:hypothetical protein
VVAEVRVEQDGVVGGQQLRLHVRHQVQVEGELAHVHVELSDARQVWHLLMGHVAHHVKECPLAGGHTQTSVPLAFPFPSARNTLYLDLSSVRIGSFRMMYVSR